MYFQKSQCDVDCLDDQMFKRMITTSECLSPESTKSLQIGKKVSLSPLKAQVGGHVYMKLLNDNHVCKPLNDREVKFYQNTPKMLLQHVPKFLGTVQIQQQQQQHNGESSIRYKYLTFIPPKYVLHNSCPGPRMYASNIAKLLNNLDKSEAP